MAKEAAAGPPNRELYALLNISPEASDEEIRKAYRQWAQIYHPDKYLAPQMKDIATENFQRICEAYEILTDEHKRQIYDIYGMEGLNSAMELGPKLSKTEEIKEELERLKRQKELEKMSANFSSSGRALATLSLPRFLEGRGIMKGVSMSSEFQSQLSKSNVVAVSGNMSVKRNSGGAGATAALQHQISPFSSVDLVASAGLRSLIAVQTTRHLTSHCTATMGLAMSLRDGSFNLSNTWIRRLSESTTGNISLVLGTESLISVGWEKQEKELSTAAELKLGTGTFGVSGHYTRRLSEKSHGRIAGRVGSNVLEFEVGGGRKITEFSTVRLLYTIGIQGVSWRFEWHRGDQKIIVPILLFRDLNYVLASAALVIPTSFYFAIKKFVVKPYNRKLEKQKTLENVKKTRAQVKEARAAAGKAQQLLENVANRKKNKQIESNGLVIREALYGNPKAIKNKDKSNGQENDEVSSQFIDVTLPLNFLVTESSQLKLHDGVKKSGIMGFCDPCPGESKQLLVEYTYNGNRYEAIVEDCQGLIIPQESHRF